MFDANSAFQEGRQYQLDCSLLCEKLEYAYDYVKHVEKYATYKDPDVRPISRYMEKEGFLVLWAPSKGDRFTPGDLTKNYYVYGGKHFAESLSFGLNQFLKECPKGTTRVMGNYRVTSRHVGFYIDVEDNMAKVIDTFNNERFLSQALHSNTKNQLNAIDSAEINLRFEKIFVNMIPAFGGNVQRAVKSLEELSLFGLTKQGAIEHGSFDLDEVTTIEDLVDTCRYQLWTFTNHCVVHSEHEDGMALTVTVQRDMTVVCQEMFTQ